MTAMLRESYHHGDLRNALLGAALDLVRETGSTRFPLRDLADRVGVTQPAIYRHFDDLSDLLSTLCRDGFTVFAEIERRVMAESQDPWIQLQGLIRAYIRFCTGNPGYFRIMFDSGIANQPENIARAQPTFQIIVDTIAKTDTDNGSSCAFEKAVALWAAMHGISALMLSGQLGAVLSKPERAARLEKAVADLIERGLGGPSA
ncbi:MAG: TetR/AcrR family transcriptional regulator [Dongiaceae bacterium]